MNYVFTTVTLFFLSGELLGQEYPVIKLPAGKTVTLMFEDRIGNAGTTLLSYSEQSVQRRANANRFSMQVLKRNLSEGSLYLELESGHFYQFLLQPDDDATQLFYRFSLTDALGVNPFGTATPQQPLKTEPDAGLSDDQTDIQQVARACLKENDNCGLGEEKESLQFTCTGIYYKDDHLYFKLNFYNRSHLPFEIKLIDVNKVNKQGLRRNTSDPIPVPPLFVLNQSISTVDGKGSHQKVLVFDKFTISSKRLLRIELLEDNGDRTHQINIPGKQIILAQKLK